MFHRFAHKDEETQRACPVPKVLQPGSGGAQLYFLIYVLLDMVVNNQEERNPPGSLVALSSLRRGFVGINCGLLGHRATSP